MPRVELEPKFISSRGEHTGYCAIWELELKTPTITGFIKFIFIFISIGASFISCCILRWF